MASRTQPTHYEVLGVAPDASADVVRKAYIDKARALHPDHFADRTLDQRVEAERRMQEVNEAWRVLQDPGRRQRYDRELMPAVDRVRLQAEEDRFANRADGTEPEIVDLDSFDGTTRIIRGLPWLLLIGVLFLIFVFTAYAATGGSSTPAPQHANQCVTIAASINGPVTTAAACNVPGARSVVSRVGPGQPCPTDSERLQPMTDPYAMCLEVG